MSKVAILSLLALANAQDNIITAKCNYAVHNFAPYGGHPYPTGVCSKERTANGTETSFKFVCNDQGTIDLEEYDDFDCSGTPVVSQDLSSGGNDTDLVTFECGMDACDYALSCSYGSCGTNTSDPMVNTCANCVSDPDLYEVQCQAFITNECYGFAGQYKKDECSNSKMTEYFYFGTGCDTPAFSEELGGLSASDYCSPSTSDGVTNHYYHTVQCVTTGTTMAPQTTIVVETTEDNDTGACMRSVAVVILFIFVSTLSM